LEQQIVELKSEIEDLKAAFAQFKEQFE